MINLRIGESDIQENVSLVEKASQLGLDRIRIEKLPQPVVWEGNLHDTGDYKLAYVNVDWRDGGLEIIKRTVNRYEPLQNKTMIDIFNPLSLKYKLNSVGMLGDRGEVFFFEFNLPDFYIGDDQHGSKFLVADHREGGGFYVGHTSTRFFCTNQFTNQLNGIYPISHSNDTKAVMEFLVMVEEKMISERDLEIATLNKMFKTKVEKGVVNEMVTKIFPEPKKSKKLNLFEEGMEKYDIELNPEQTEILEKQTYVYENAMDRVERRRQFLADEFFRYAGEVGDSVYALWNAVTDMTSNSDLYRGEDNKFYQTVYGERAKTNQLAWNFCKGLI